MFLLRLTVGLAALAIGVPALTATELAAATPAPSISVQLARPGGASLALAGVDIEVGGVTQQTGPTGSVEFDNLTAGSTYAVVASLPQKYVQQDRVLVVPTSDRTVVKVLAAVGATISGRYTTSGGSAVAGARMRLFNNSGTQVGGVTTSATGRYKFIGLPTGNYRVQFNASSRDVPTAPEAKYTWSFYKSRTYDGSPAIAVKQQRSTAGATTVTGINATAYKGRVLTVNTNGFGESITILGTSSATSFSRPVASFPVSLRLPPGAYRVAVSIGSQRLWYYLGTGSDAAEGSTATGNVDYATTVTMRSTSNRSIALNLVV